MSNGSNGMNQNNRQDLYLMPLVRGKRIEQDELIQQLKTPDISEAGLTWLVKKDIPPTP